MSNTELCNQMMDTFNNRDWVANRALIADDCTYIEFATGMETNGPDAWIQNSQQWAGALSNAKGEITSSFESGNTVVQEITWSGTMDGPMMSPDGQTIPPTNKSMVTKATWIITVENGKATRAHHYFDMMSMMVQLGLAG